MLRSSYEITYSAIEEVFSYENVMRLPIAPIKKYLDMKTLVQNVNKNVDI